MKIAVWSSLLLLVAVAPANAQSASQPPHSTTAGAIPIAELVASIAKRTGKTFVVDPRVRAEITLVGEGASSVSYDEFLTILGVHGYVAMDRDGFVSVVPDGNARQLPGPILSGKEKHSDAEFVTAVIKVKSLPAAQLVPILRPLLPQTAHLAALAYGNSLIMADSYGNVKRIEAIVKSVDTGPPYTAENNIEKCAATEPTASK